MSNKQKRSAKSLRAARGGSRSRKTGVMSEPRTNGMTMYKSPRTVMPSTYVTNLKYITDVVMTSVAGTQSSVRYTNNAYDVDPTLGSTAMPGFAELAGVYARFRTLRISYKFSACNQEAFPVSVIHGFAGTSIATTALSIQYAGNPLFSLGCLGPLTGQCRGRFSKSAALTEIVGSKQPLYDDLFTGSTTSSTITGTGLVYCYFGVVTPAVMTAAGIFLTTEITLQVQFYKPNFLLT